MPARFSPNDYSTGVGNDYPPSPALDDALAAAWPLAHDHPDLRAALEHLDNYPPEDHGRHAGPAHYRTNRERILYALASASEHPGSDLILDWHRQHNAGAAPDLSNPPRALAYLLEQQLRTNPETDAAALITLLHHAQETTAPVWNEPAVDWPTPPPAVYSFDIDDTIDLGDGYPAPVTWEQIRDLQQRGYIVGSCSDRDTADQRIVWQEAGVAENFAIPKELLWALKAAWPGVGVYHVGDSDRRDRIPAEQQGVAFIQHTNFVWP